jgi:triosephosphate isomerase
MIVVNFKTYEEVTSWNNGFKLAKICEEVFQTYRIPMILCVQATDIYKIKQVTSLPIFAQHIDAVEPGKNTGFITWLAVKEAGAMGVMINHSEHRIGMENIVKTVEICKRENLRTLVCVENAEEAASIDTIEPEMIALEDPILIGGEVSIIKNEEGKKKVEEFIAKRLKASCLVGAGVKGKEDVSESLRLGASGVLLASGVTKAEDPKKVLIELCEGFNRSEM